LAYFLATVSDVPGKIEAVANMICRDDDILLTVYPKSGLFMTLYTFVLLKSVEFRFEL